MLCADRKIAHYIIYNLWHSESISDYHIGYASRVQSLVYICYIASVLLLVLLGFFFHVFFFFFLLAFSLARGSHLDIPHILRYTVYFLSTKINNWGSLWCISNDNISKLPSSPVSFKKIKKIKKIQKKHCPEHLMCSCSGGNKSSHNSEIANIAMFLPVLASLDFYLD